MNEIPDYSKYTFNELEEVSHAVDRKMYPENFQAIENEIKIRKEELTALYSSARSACEEDCDVQKAKGGFQKVIKEYPDSSEAQYASEFINNINSKKEGEEIGKQQQELKLEFNGSPKEYFRIWIVNLCLTLLSFGIFSAWAKVRKKRYCYSHLSLDGTPFQYLGQPIPILKGRIIAAVIFLLYYLSNHVFITLFPYVLGAGLVLAPWVLVQSAAFNARYSAYRNMTFRFDGTYLGALKVLSAWGIVPVLVIGTIFKWQGALWAAGVSLGLFGLLFPWWFRNIKNFIATNTIYGGQSGQFGATGGEFWRIYFMSGLIVSAFGVVSAITIAISVSLLKNTPLNTQYTVYVFMLPVYAGYILAYAYIQANMTNAVWNKIRLGPVSFQIRLKSFDMAKLYLTNALGIVASAGMLTPWAVIRTFRYRADHMQVLCHAELTDFQGSKADNVQAAGAELSEIFDMDLSI
jgi:uncharacterized membrane protein YjgN (DUF898 family)